MERPRTDSTPGRVVPPLEKRTIEREALQGEWDNLKSAVTEIAETLCRVEDKLNRLSAQREDAPPSVPPAFLSPSDAAKFLGVEPSTLEYMRKARKLRHIKVGSQRGFVYSLDDLKEFAAKQTILTAHESLKNLQAKRRGRS
jgi:hypothetical protein